MVQWTRFERFRPSLSVGFYPSFVRYRTTAPRLESGRLMTYADSAALNLTTDFGLFEVTPFGGIVVFASERLHSPRLLPQVGLSLALRGAKISAARADEASAAVVH